MKVIWSQPAESDLDALYDFIAKDSPIYAEQFTDTILDAVAHLADYPRVGRRVPEADSESIRELIVQSERVIYAVDDESQTIHILALIHVRQDLQGNAQMPWD